MIDLRTVVMLLKRLYFQNRLEKSSRLVPGSAAGIFWVFGGPDSKKTLDLVEK